MTLPASLAQGLRLPLVAAPMLRVSGVDLVSAACCAGVIGAFPTVNARSSQELDAWPARIAADPHARRSAPGLRLRGLGARSALGRRVERGAHRVKGRRGAGRWPNSSSASMPSSRGAARDGGPAGQAATATSVIRARARHTTACNGTAATSPKVDARQGGARSSSNVCLICGMHAPHRPTPCASDTGRKRGLS